MLFCVTYTKKLEIYNSLLWFLLYYQACARSRRYTGAHTHTQTRAGRIFSYNFCGFDRPFVDPRVLHLFKYLYECLLIFFSFACATGNKWSPWFNFFFFCSSVFNILRLVSISLLVCVGQQSPIPCAYTYHTTYINIIVIPTGSISIFLSSRFRMDNITIYTLVMNSIIQK